MALMTSSAPTRPRRSGRRGEEDGMQEQFKSAINRVTGYQSAQPIFIHIDDWNAGIVSVFKAFCKAQGLTVKEGEARGKKTLRISR